MVTTRAGDNANGQAEAPPAAAGEKHSIDDDAVGTSPDAKRAKKSDDTRQTTLEETLAKQDDTEATRQTTLEETLEKQDDTEATTAEAKGEKADVDTEMKDQDANGTDNAKSTDDAKAAEAKEEPTKDDTGGKKEDIKTETAEEKSESNEKADVEQGSGDTAEIPHEDKKVPSNILEKGIVYFFFRARVNTDQPEEVDDIARSYMILRPMAPDSKLGDGPIGDAGNTRLLALPKKVLPVSGRDRFMVFVEKFGPSFSDLKEQFLSSGENQNKSGNSHVPAATPAGEGVYVITTTGRESHLAYMLTLPEKLGEVQSDLGLKEQGSFILSTKNPKFPGPANARLPEGPDFPEKIKEEFRDLRWMPSKPEHLDYVNAQILMIGESSGIRHATEPRKKDVEKGNEEPKEVLEEIEEEDTKRMENLADDDSTAIFTDLQARAKDYPKLKTTF